MLRIVSLCVIIPALWFASGCGLITSTTIGKAYVTAVPLSAWNQDEPHGIPYYLPKPLLVIAKNVRHVEESPTGLTNPAPIPNSFDNQASYADVKANVSIPAGTGVSQSSDKGGPGSEKEDGQVGDAPTLPVTNAHVVANSDLDDGLNPKVYYTYQIVFIPDLSQKYGLRVRGGPGEIRAAMNFVNGWMYTGMGPYYIKDSATAQNLMACGVGAMYAGRGVADVVGQAANLAGGPGSKEAAPMPESDAAQVMQKYIDYVESKRDEQVVREIPNYAEIVIYEPVLTDCGETEWRLVAHQAFDRKYFASGRTAEDAGHDLINGMLKLKEAEILPAPGGANGDTRAESARLVASQSQAAELPLVLNDFGQAFAAQALGVGSTTGRQEAGALEATTVATEPAVPAQQRHPCRLPCPTISCPCLCDPQVPAQYRTVETIVSPDMLFSPPPSLGIGSTSSGPTQVLPQGQNPSFPANSTATPTPAPSGPNGVPTTGGAPPPG